MDTQSPERVGTLSSIATQERAPGGNDRPHTTRFQRVVNPPVGRGRPAVPIADRFWSKVEKTVDCWLWVSNVHHNGYGLIALSRNGRKKQLWARAHRVAWELTHGLIPAGQEVCHRCDVPRCVNPAHLFLGTHVENMADSMAKGRLTAWRTRGVRLNGERTQQALKSASAGAERERRLLDGLRGVFELVPHRLVPVTGEVR